MANTAARTRKRPSTQQSRMTVRRTSSTAGRRPAKAKAKKGSGGALAGLLARNARKAKPTGGKPNKGALVGGGLALAAAAGAALKKRKSSGDEAQYAPQPDGLPNEPTRPVGATPPPVAPSPAA